MANEADNPLFNVPDGAWLDTDVPDSAGVPFAPVRTRLGELDVTIPPVVIAQALADAKRASERQMGIAGAAGGANGLTRLAKMAGPFVGAAASAILSVAYGLYGRYAPRASAPRPCPPGVDPVDYAMGYLASLALHALGARTWRLDYAELATEDEGIVITRIYPSDAPPDRRTQAPDGAASGDVGADGHGNGGGSQPSGPRH